MILLTTILAIPLLFALGLYALHWAVELIAWPHAIAAFRATAQRAGLPANDQGAAIASFERARAIDRGIRIYDAMAPLAVAVALCFTPRSANALPAWAAKWANNIGINGDSGATLLPSGAWLQWRDTPEAQWDDLTTCPQLTYDDPRYGGDAYYCRGHHPRSWLARWVWLGWRNRCSLLSEQRGATITRASVVNLVGTQNLTQSSMGAFIARCGEHYHFKQHTRRGRWVIVRSLGFKLGAPGGALYEPRQAAAVCIPFALKSHKQP